MGTNYYVRVAEDVPPLHVGKKSVGWDFLFRAHPDLGLTTVAAWRDFIAEPGNNTIVTEYDTIVDTDAFFAMATARPGDDPSIRRTHDNDAPEDLMVTPYTYDMDAQGVPFLDCEFC